MEYAVLAAPPNSYSVAPVDELPNELTLTDWNALAIAVAPGSRRARRAARLALRGVLDPLAAAGESLGLDSRAIGSIQRAVLLGTHAQGVACGAWDAPTWTAVAATARSFRPNVLAVAYRLRC